MEERKKFLILYFKQKKKIYIYQQVLIYQSLSTGFFVHELQQHFRYICSLFITKAAVLKVKITARYTSDVKPFNFVKFFF